MVLKLLLMSMGDCCCQSTFQSISCSVKWKETSSRLFWTFPSTCSHACNLKQHPLLLPPFLPFFSPFFCLPVPRNFAPGPPPGCLLVARPTGRSCPDPPGECRSPPKPSRNSSWSCLSGAAGAAGGHQPNQHPLPPLPRSIFCRNLPPSPPAISIPPPAGACVGLSFAPVRLFGRGKPRGVRREAAKASSCV